MNIKKSILLRVRIAFLGMGMVAMAIILKIAHIQIVEGEKWQTKAEKRDIQHKSIPARRGSIYAQDGSLLATSLPFYKVAIDPTVANEDIFKQNIDSLSYLLSEVFKDETPKGYKKLLEKARKENRRYVLLSAKNVNYQTKKDIEKFPILREGKYKGGAIFEVENRRFNPFGMLAGRTVGYINQKNEGAVGLEYSFDRQLAGKNGQALFQYISSGAWKPLNDGSSIEPEDGVDIYTTIDINVQDVAHTTLYEALVENDADFGCVIVMEVKTGEIKAMTNLGKIRDGVYTENYNYAIGDRGSTDPGSVFKLASMMALLEDNKVRLDEKVDTGEGVYKFFGTPLNDPKSGGFGTITAQQVFENSSSIGIAKLVQNNFKDNPQRYINYLHKFGLSTPLHFQLVGESTPYIKNTNDPTWSAISLPWMSVGYEIKISPLQMLVYYNAVANDGKMIQPLIVKDVKNADDVIEEFQGVVLKEKICSDSTLSKVKMLLEGVVERGTARAIKTAQYRIAGKTSTSQKFRSGKYVKAYHTSFAGFFPADNPKYSCIVVIDNPKKERQSGGDVAAPVFRIIADKLYANDLQMQPDEGHFKNETDKNSSPRRFVANTSDTKVLFKEWHIEADFQKEIANWIEGKKMPDESVSLKAIEIKRNLMPDVRGMTLRDAIYLLENQGLKVAYDGKGKVISQSLRPDKPFKRGRTIYLELE